MVKEYVQNLFKGQGSRPESSSTAAGRIQEENAAIIAVPKKPADEDTDQQKLGSREEANPDSPSVIVIHLVTPITAAPLSEPQSQKAPQSEHTSKKRSHFDLQYVRLGDARKKQKATEPVVEESIFVHDQKEVKEELATAATTATKAAAAPVRPIPNERILTRV